MSSLVNLRVDFGIWLQILSSLTSLKNLNLVGNLAVEKGVLAKKGNTLFPT